MKYIISSLVFCSMNVIRILNKKYIVVKKINNNLISIVHVHGNN